MPTIYACGPNADYDLGFGDNTARTTFSALSGEWKKIVSKTLASGNKGGAGIKSDGTLWAWGDNDYNVFGLPNASYTTPTQIGSVNTWVDVSLGDNHMAAIKADGTLWTCGRNTDGQCGLGNTTSPVSTLTQVGSLTTWENVTAGYLNTHAIKSDGTLWSCGDGYFGLNGDNTEDTDRSSMVQEYSASTNWSSVSHNYSHVIGVKSDGTLWAWGKQDFGQCGQGVDGPTLFRPTQIGSGTTWIKASAGYYITHAIKSDGTLWACGRGYLYGLGTGSETNQLSLVQIGSSNNWLDVDSGYLSAIAINSEHDVYIVGYNQNGVLGTGDSVNVQTFTNLSLLYDVDSVYLVQQAAFLTELAQGYAFAPITITVDQAYNATAPISVTVGHQNGTASAPVKVNVRSSGTAVAAMRVAVVDDLDTTAWTVGITLGGVDISARLTGAIRIDAEEAAARTAEFAFFPASGELDPADLLSAQVVINLIRVIDAVQVPTRIFTGVVEIANFDPVAGLIILSCHDDLKNKLSALSIDQIDALTYNSLALDYSPGALGAAAADRWDYAQARMECVSGALDAGVYGQLRSTSFAGSASWGTFAAADIFDASISIDLPQRSDIINKVIIDFEYRQHRCRERHAYIAWANTIIGGTDSLASGYQSPSIDAVKSAVEGVDWEPISASYNYGYQYVKTSAPSGQVENGDWWYVGTQTACGSMVAELGQRHAQPFTEQYEITVTCASSAQTFGYREKELRGAVSTDWDPGEWERDWTITTPDATTEEVDYAGTQDRTIADEAIKTLCMMAQRQILQSHRTCRVNFDIPCLPEIDLIHYASIDTDSIDASGKIARIQHLIDIDAGSAKTTLTLAVNGVGAVGGATNTVLQTPPPPPVWGPGPDDAEGWIDDTWVMDLPTLSRYVGSVTNHSWSENYNGYLVNAPEYLSVVNFTLGITVQVENPYYAVGWEFPQTGFKVTMPRVYENYRSAPAIKTISDERTCIVTASNPLTLTIGA